MEATGVVEHRIEWKTFSLEQVNLGPDDEADALWASPESRRGLLPAAAQKWAEAQGSDELATVQLAFFEARHTHRKKIGRPEVVAEVLAEAGFAGNAVAAELTSDRSWLDAARADHEEADAMGVFGVPTLVFPDTAPVFLRLLEITDGDRAVEIYGRVVQMAADPIVHEFKRPSG